MIPAAWIAHALIKCPLIPRLKVCLPGEEKARFFSTADEARKQCPSKSKLKFKNVWEVKFPWEEGHTQIFDEASEARKIFEEKKQDYISRWQPIVSQQIECLANKEWVRSFSCLRAKSILYVNKNDSNWIKEWFVSTKCKIFSLDCEFYSRSDEKGYHLRTIQVARGNFSSDDLHILIIDFGLNYIGPIEDLTLIKFLSHTKKWMWNTEMDSKILDSYSIELGEKTVDAQAEMGKRFQLNPKQISLGNMAQIFDFKMVNRPKVDHKTCWKKENLDQETFDYAVEDALLVWKFAMLLNELNKRNL